MIPVPFNDLQRGIRSQAATLEAAATAVLRSGWLVLGSAVQAFEREFARYCGTAACISVANGSEALELALRAIGVGRDSRVACVANAGFYAPIAIHALGAQPVFMEIAADTLQVDPESARQILAQRPAALVVTHLYGRLAEVETVLELARNCGVPVIEDCAQAHGAERGGVRAGAFADIGCFSFYPTKNLGALGDGGACVTQDAGLAQRLRELRQYGWTTKYAVSTPGGRNSRLDEIQAAMLSVRLTQLDAANARRRAIADSYRRAIRHPLLHLLPDIGTADVAHLFVVRTAQRDALRDHLRAAGIGCDVHYPIADHQQLAYAEQHRDVHLPLTEQACRQVLSLPCFPELTDPEIAAVVDAIHSWQPGT